MYVHFLRIFVCKDKVIAHVPALVFAVWLLKKIQKESMQIAQLVHSRAK